MGLFYLKGLQSLQEGCEPAEVHLHLLWGSSEARIKEVHPAVAVVNLSRKTLTKGDKWCHLVNTKNLMLKVPASGVRQTWV